MRHDQDAAVAAATVADDARSALLADLLGRVAGRHILAIQDTTSLHDDGDKHSLNLHPTIAVDATEGALLGLVSADLLERDGSPKAHCNKRRLDEKESRRWGDATRQRAMSTYELTTIGWRQAWHRITKLASTESPQLTS